MSTTAASASFCTPLSAQVRAPASAPAGAPGPTPLHPRPVRAPVPTMPSLDALNRTHRQMMVVLGELKELVQWLDGSDADEKHQQQARKACEFFSGRARQHHADEENMVFPGLLDGDDATCREHVLRLQQDHRWMEEDWLLLQPHLQAVASGQRRYSLNVLRKTLPAFESVHREHIALEESLVYPCAGLHRLAG